jgi:hypothetical protein
MRKKLLQLLKGLEAAIPPPLNCHHVISFAQYGSDVDGWEDKLVLQLNQDGVFQQFFLDAADMEGNPQILIDYVQEQLPNPGAQLGVGPGRYVK